MVFASAFWIYFYIFEKGISSEDIPFQNFSFFKNVSHCQSEVFENFQKVWNAGISLSFEANPSSKHWIIANLFCFLFKLSFFDHCKIFWSYWQLKTPHPLFCFSFPFFLLIFFWLLPKVVMLVPKTICLLKGIPSRITDWEFCFLIPYRLEIINFLEFLFLTNFKA